MHRLIAACAGTATAASSLITSAKIKNNSIKRADIKNRSIKGKDLHSSAIPTTAGSGVAGANGAAGPAGPAGPAGATGAKGDTGDRGPSNATMVFRNNVALSNRSICSPFPCFRPAVPRGATMSLPAGEYVAFGKVQADIPADSQRNMVSCTLSAPDVSDNAAAMLGDRDTDNPDGTENQRTGDQRHASLSLQSAFTVPAGGAEAKLTCVGDAVIGATITARIIKLTAIQVGDATVTEVTG